MKNLAILINSMEGGGAEKVVSILLDKLRFEFNITLILLGPGIKYNVPANIKVINLNSDNYYESSFLKILRLPILAIRYKRISRKLKLDVSFSFMYRSNFINVLSKLFGMSSKCIVSERNTPSLTYSGTSISSIVGRLLIKMLYPKSDLIVANSLGNSSDLQTNFSIHESKIQVIHNPVDIDKIIKLGQEQVEEIHFNDKFTFISVARLEAHKNHDITINAFSKILNDKCQLLILGEGPEKTNLEILIQDLKLQGKVFLVGFQSNPYKFLSKSNAFILSSRREGFPNSLLEALAFNLILISSDCKSGPREILKNSKTGMLYEVGDIETLKLKMIDSLNMYNSKLRAANLQILYDFRVDGVINHFKNIIIN